MRAFAIHALLQRTIFLQCGLPHRICASSRYAVRHAPGIRGRQEMGVRSPDISCVLTLYGVDLQRQIRRRGDVVGAANYPARDSHLRGVASQSDCPQQSCPRARTRACGVDKRRASGNSLAQRCQQMASGKEAAVRYKMASVLRLPV